MGFFFALCHLPTCCVFLFFFWQYHKPVYRPNHCLVSVLCTQIISLLFQIFFFCLLFPKILWRKCFFDVVLVLLVLFFCLNCYLYISFCVDWSSILLHWHNIYGCERKTAPFISILFTVLHFGITKEKAYIVHGVGCR